MSFIFLKFNRLMIDALSDIEQHGDIGNCPISLFNANLENPCFVCVGDQIQFYATNRAEYDLDKIETEVGIYNLDKIKLDA